MAVAEYTDENGQKFKATIVSESDDGIATLEFTKKGRPQRAEGIPLRPNLAGQHYVKIEEDEIEAETVEEAIPETPVEETTEIIDSA